MEKYLPEAVLDGDYIPDVDLHVGVPSRCIPHGEYFPDVDPHDRVPSKCRLLNCYNI